MIENFNITMEEFFRVNVLGYINELYMYPVKLISLVLDLAIVTCIIVFFIKSISLITDVYSKIKKI